MSFNPLEFKHGIAGQPFRIARHLVGPQDEVEDTEAANLGALLILGTGAAYTAAANLAAPFALIQSGVSGNRYFTGLSVGYSKLGYPMPLFNYVTPASSATKLGAKLGGKVGAAKLGGKLAGRLIPGVGWALLAYDVYDIAANRSLWGFDLS